MVLGASYSKYGDSQLQKSDELIVKAGCGNSGQTEDNDHCLEIACQEPRKSLLLPV